MFAITPRGLLKRYAQVDANRYANSISVNVGK